MNAHAHQEKRRLETALASLRTSTDTEFREVAEQVHALQVAVQELGGSAAYFHTWAFELSEQLTTTRRELAMLRQEHGETYQFEMWAQRFAMIEEESERLREAPRRRSTSLPHR